MPGLRASTVIRGSLTGFCELLAVFRAIARVGVSRDVKNFGAFVFNVLGLSGFPVGGFRLRFRIQTIIRIHVPIK